MSFSRKEDAGHSTATMRNPFFLGSLAALIINDHYLKDQFHNAVTGKLSDFAGLFVVGFVAIAASRRHQKKEYLPIATIAIVFTAAKTIPWVTSTIVAGLDFLLPWSNTIITDPTDLMALAILPLTTLTFNNVTKPHRRSFLRLSPHLYVSDKKDPPENRLTTFFLALVTVVACTATSVEDPETHYLARSDDGQVVRVGSTAIATAEDGGKPDVRAQPVNSDSPRIRLPIVAFTARTKKTEDCVPDQSAHCFRISGVGTIEETTDQGKSWVIIWRVSTTSLTSREVSGLDDVEDSYALQPTDIEVGRDGTFVVLLGNDHYTSRTLGGVWTNPDSTYRQVPFEYWLQIVLSLSLLFAVISLALQSLKIREFQLWLTFFVFGSGLLVMAYRYIVYVLPIPESAALIYTAALVLSLAFFLEKPTIPVPHARLLLVIVPIILVGVSTIPILIWKGGSTTSFEKAAGQSAALIVIAAPTTYYLTSWLRKTVLPMWPPPPRPPSVPPPPGPLRYP